MAISDWPLDRRPRERLLAEGPEALLDAELLAVLLRTGVQGKDAIELGRELLVRFGSITGLLSAGLELLNVKGLGQAKTAQFAAAMELARRGFAVTGLDLSLPLLICAADQARTEGLNVNFVHGDMREITFEEEFDALNG